MKLFRWLAGAVLVGGVVFAMRGCLSKPDPDERLAGRFEKMCKIAHDNIDTPEKGVRQLGRYAAQHTGDILGELGDTITTIEKIGDDDKHDARARLARERLYEPLHGCEHDWESFWLAVQEDPKASELVQHAAERLSRTFEIIFKGKHVELRDVPRELEKVIE